MADTTLIARVGELTSRLDAALARIQNLEADRCLCGACAERRHYAGLAARFRRHLEIHAMPPAERDVAVEAMDSYDRAQFLHAIAPRDAVATVVARCSKIQGPRERAHAIDELPVALRDSALAELIDVPDLVELALVPGYKLGRFTAEISREDADRLMRAGVVLGVRKHGSYANYRRTLQIGEGAKQVVERKTIQAIRSVDPEMDGLICSGTVTMRDLTDAETREHLRTGWRVTPDSRPSAPAGMSPEAHA